MDYNDYMRASLTDQMEMLFKAAIEQQEQLKPENYYTASPIDQIKIMVNSMKEEQKKIESGYYNTAPLLERTAFMARQIQEQIRKEIRLKIEEITFFMNRLQDNKNAVIFLLDQIDKNDPNVGNLNEVNHLLDRLLFLMNEMLKKQQELDNLH